MNGSNDKITNNIAEIKACITAIINITNNKMYNNNTIKIYSDSTYVINSITIWCKNWEKNNWQKYNKKKKQKENIKNKDLIITLYNLYNKYNIIFTHIKAHCIEPLNKKSLEYKLWFGNKIADKLAVKASKTK